MVRCPNCENEISKPRKGWKYGRFDAQEYLCDKCGTKFNEYSRDGKHSFTLQLKKGKGYVKV